MRQCECMIGCTSHVFIPTILYMHCVCVCVCVCVDVCDNDVCVTCL
jgi:hypothetical protein